MNKELDGPMKSAFESDTTGVIMQELTTYRIAEGMLRIEKTQRRFTNDGKDYNDSSSITPLGKVNNP